MKEIFIKFLEKHVVHPESGKIKQLSEYNKNPELLKKNIMYYSIILLMLTILIKYNY